MKKTVWLLAVLLALPLVARAQKAVSQTDGVEETATIEAIDHTGRMVTLKDKDGVEETIYCGPEVKRFDELKVGDTVTFKYYESVAYTVRKAGQPAGAATTDEPKVTRGTGPTPGATSAKQQKAVVTINAIDPKVPSITVTTDEGHKASFKVQDKKNLEGVKVGDKVEVTYTQAVMISVK